MYVRHLAAAVLATVLTFGEALSPSKAVTVSAAPSTTAELLRRMASETPDDCSAPAPPPSSSVDVSQLENQLFEAVKGQVAAWLNAPSAAVISNAEVRATTALREVEQSSAENNKSWPDDARFHFKVLKLPPAILVEMSYRYHSTFVLFSSFYLNKYAATDPGTQWREVDFVDPNAPASGVDLYPLHRGPSGRARFLARVWKSGCAGSIGEDYYGYEWSSNDGQVASEIIKIQGAEGLDDAASTHVGTLSTTGSFIQLPYCFFSAVDTWDNPTLCAADSFDLSGDHAVLSGRIYNRPDLVTIAKAVQYAEDGDYRAVLCQA